MEQVELPIHKHPLFPSARFCFDNCEGCGARGYIYGGYVCNEPGCAVVFHKDCAESKPEINHPLHPNHPLKLDLTIEGTCGSCGLHFSNKGVYHCSICDFTLNLGCARRPIPPPALEHSKVHEHPLVLFDNRKESSFIDCCVTCNKPCFRGSYIYECGRCNLFFHLDCDKLFPEIYNICHPSHPLKFLTRGTPGYADQDCLLCAQKLRRNLHHCDVCNFSICTPCAENPPPLDVVCLRTHEHSLHLFPRHMVFTCNACGTQGDRSPYFCLQCNFMIHRDCIDLPRVININRHDHRISYTSYLGPAGNWTCGVCRQKVDGFYGGYMCLKNCNYVVHSRCATSSDVWDKIELYGRPEEVQVAPFEVIDENTIKHFSHDHNLRLNKDCRMVHESLLCKACACPIYLDSFYYCEECDFALHEACAYLPRKKRHMCHNQLFTLQTHSLREPSTCHLCSRRFTGFRYESGPYTLDVRCASILEPFVNESHTHPLYFAKGTSKRCSECDNMWYVGMLSCDECVFSLDFKCAVLPKKVMKQRYDDHPLFLSYGESKVDGKYWCDVCERKVDPKKWFYTCNACGVALHVSCIVNDISYVMPGQFGSSKGSYEVVLNTSNCRPLCSRCHSRCNLLSVIKFCNAYYCSFRCFFV